MCFKRRMKWASRLIFYTKGKGQQSVEAISLGIIILHFPRSNSSHQAHYAHLCSILPFSLSLSVSLESRKIEIDIGMKIINQKQHIMMALLAGTLLLNRGSALLFLQRLMWKFPKKKNRSVTDFSVWVFVWGERKEKENFLPMSDAFYAFCAFGRTDGWHVDWLFQSFSSFGSQVRSSNNFFFFEKRETKQNKKPTDYTHKEQRATHGESDRVRYTHITTISCVQSVRSIKLRLRLSRGLVGSFVPYVFIDIFIYTCMYV